MKILIAWELGANYGHLLRQLPVARELRSRGHDVLFVVRDVSLARQTLQADDIAFTQSPVPRLQGQLKREISSFSDILVTHGFDELDTLHSLVLSWQHLYQLHATEAVIIEYAPAAMLAARLSGIPTANLSTGFDLPPPVSPYPSFRPWLGLPPANSLQTEAHILSNLNALCAAQQRPRFENLADFMRPDAAMLATFQELDHYHERLNGRYVGPLFTIDAGISVTWPSGHVKHIFVYIRPNRVSESILGILRQTHASIICFIPGIHPDLKQQMETPTLKIFTSPLKLDALLPQCDLAITLSGNGLLAACLLAGIPMLVIPTQIEQLLLTHCVQRMGTGLALSFDQVPAEFLISVNRLLAEPGFRKRAKAIAHKYKGYDQQKTVGLIVDTIERLPADAACRMDDLHC